MSFLRPEAVATLRRWREVILGGAITALGGWIFTLGGYFFFVLGSLIAAIGAGIGILALRRMRFFHDVSDPGIVQIDEGQITYFGPTETGPEGGFAGLSTLTEIALITRGGRRVWRLSQTGLPTLYIPTAAEGAEALFDAFSGLPGLDSGVLLDAVEGPADLARIVWRRPLDRRLLRRRG